MNEGVLDRDVRDILSAGPQTAPTAVVDRAIAEAARTRQRRPRFRRFDPRAWPAARASIAATAIQPTPSRMSLTARLSLVTATAVVSAALIGGVVMLGGGLVQPSRTAAPTTTAPQPSAGSTLPALSPTGVSNSLIVLVTDGTNGTIRAIRPDGLVVGDVSGSTNGCDRLVLGSDGKRVAFVFQGLPLTIASLGGSDRLWVPRSSPTGMGWAFSPDRTRFAYLAGTSERSDLTIVSLVDGSATVIARDLRGASLDWSGWSVDDTLAIGVMSETEIGVDLIGADGSDLRSLTRQPRGERSIRDAVMLSWSPDGARLAYARGTPGPHETRVVDIATGRSVVVATADGKPVAAWMSVTNSGHFLWSPDGRQVGYATNGRYALLELETGQSRIVGDALWRPFWSPDGSRLAFQGQGGPGHLTTFRADLSGRVDLVVEEGITAMAWSPDSRQIAVLSGRSLVIVDPLGIEAPVRIANDVAPGCLTWWDIDTP